MLRLSLIWQVAAHSSFCGFCVSLMYLLCSLITFLLSGTYFQGALISFSGKWKSEAKSCALVLCIAIGVWLFPGLRWTELGNIYQCNKVCIPTHTTFKFMSIYLYLCISVCLCTWPWIHTSTPSPVQHHHRVQSNFLLFRICSSLLWQ